MTQKKDQITVGPGFLPVIALGGIIGYLLVRDFLALPIRVIAADFCLGMITAWMILHWAEMAIELRDSMRNLLPLDVDIADRAAVQQHLDGLKGRGAFPLRLRRLLQAWVVGLSPRQVTALAAHQAQLAQNTGRAGAVFATVLLVGSVLGGAKLGYVMVALVGVAVTVFARQYLAGHIDAYVENRILTRLPPNLPQTQMTAKDLARELGGSIESAFENYVPKPEAMSSAIEGTVKAVAKTVTDEVEGLEKKLADSQAALVGKWMEAATTTTTDLKDVEKALATVVVDLTQGLSTNAEKLKSLFATHSQELAKTIDKIGVSVDAAIVKSAEKTAAASDAYGKQLRGALEEHAGKIASTSEAINAELEKIAGLGKDIENLLHIQKTVEQAMESVSASEDFRSTLAALREHLDQADTLIREAAKPRTIQLVETEREE